MGQKQPEFTHEQKPQGALETYEWDNVWWEKNGDADHSRVMYLGDSISCGIRRVWNDTAGEACYCDNCRIQTVCICPTMHTRYWPKSFWMRGGFINH